MSRDFLNNRVGVEFGIHGHIENGEPHGLRHCRAEKSLRVLLVEDTAANQKLVQTVLSKRGHHVSITSTGYQALEVIRKQSFDVILMDIRMPGIDGCEATQAIKTLADRSKATVPVIGITASATKSDEQHCLQAGMSAYVSKPFNLEHLIEVVEEVATHLPQAC